LDTTVAEQAIGYPTDLSLLNEAREFSEQIIDRLYAKSALTKKPRSYRQQARKAYLSIVKQRRSGQSHYAEGIRQQLQYLCGNLGHIGALLAAGVAITVTELATTPLLGDPVSLCAAVGDVPQQEPLR